MSSDQEKPSFDLKRPDTPSNKKHAEKNTIENDDVSWLVSWGGAFVFAGLLVASTFKRSKKIRYLKKSQDVDSDLDAGGFGENTGCADGAQKMEGLQLLLQSSSTDLISGSCHTTSEMLVKYASIEDSNSDKNRTLMTKSISEKNEDQKIVVIIYEEEYPNTDKFVENEAQKFDEISNVAKSSSFRAFDEATWLAEWTDKSSTSSSSSLSSLDEPSFEVPLEGDDKIIDIVIYIDDHENGENEDAQII